jgi:hypothetical protein
MRSCPATSTLHTPPHPHHFHDILEAWMGSSRLSAALHYTISYSLLLLSVFGGGVAAHLVSLLLRLLLLLKFETSSPLLELADP